MENGDLSKTASPYCEVVDASGNAQGGTSPYAAADIGPGLLVTLPVNGYWVTSTPNTSVWLECGYAGTSTDVETFVGEGAFTAIQVQ